MDDDSHIGDLDGAVGDAVSWAFITGVRLLHGQRAVLLLREADEPILVGSAAIGIEPPVMRSMRIRIGESVAGLAAERGAALLGSRGNEMFICAPVVAGDQVEGVLEVTGDARVVEYGDEEMAMATLLGRHIGHLLARTRAPSAHPAAEPPRRGEFREVLERELARSNRAGMPFTLALIDLGDLLATFSREQSVVTIGRVIAALQRAFRRYDFAAHRAGGEFALLLAGPSEADDSIVGRIADAIASACRGLDSEVVIRVGLSRCPHDGISADDLLTAAGARLKQGRRLTSAS